MPTLHWLTRDSDINTAARDPYRNLRSFQRRPGRR